jgi:hypothetical protein
MNIFALGLVLAALSFGSIFSFGPLFVAVVILGPALLGALGTGLVCSGMAHWRIVRPVRFGGGATILFAMAVLTAVGSYNAHIHQPPAWWHCEAAPATRYFACASFDR